MVNVVRYYHHKTVCMGGQNDDIYNVLQRAGYYKCHKLQAKKLNNAFKHSWSAKQCKESLKH